MDTKERSSRIPTNYLLRLKPQISRSFIIRKRRKILNIIQNLTNKLNIGSKVVFTGPRSDVDDFYSISDIFLFPTHYDPFSNVVLEAMNFENVVFTTSRNGASEILDEDFVMDTPYDTGVIASIDNLLSNKIALGKEKIKNKNLSKLFSIEKNLNITLKVISQIE